MNKEILEQVIEDTGFKEPVIRKAVRDYAYILKQEIENVEFYEPETFKVLTWPKLFTLVPTVKNYVKVNNKYDILGYFSEVKVSIMHKVLKEYIPKIVDFTNERSKQFKDRDNVFSNHVKLIKEKNK